MTTLPYGVRLVASRPHQDHPTL